MNWENKKVFITGATGFIGSHLRNFLTEHGAEVYSLYHISGKLVSQRELDASNWVRGDLKNYADLCEIVGKIQPDIVFHLGAQAIHDVGKKLPQLTLETNVMGTANLLDACRQYATPRAIVIASSDKAYGTSSVMPYVEEMPLRGNAPYEVSKSCTDLIAQMYKHTYLSPVTIARCGNVFGEEDLNFSRIIPYACHQIIKDEPIELRTDGSLKRDYIYVADVVDAYVILAEALYKQHSSGIGNVSYAYNFGYENPYSVLEIVGEVFRVANKFVPVYLKHTYGYSGNVEIQDQWLQCTKAHEELNWYPHQTLKYGLERTFNWYKEILK
jgi:CDP-glucose 4,6-dehydratase